MFSLELVDSILCFETQSIYDIHWGGTSAVETSAVIGVPYASIHMLSTVAVLLAAGQVKLFQFGLQCIGSQFHVALVDTSCSGLKLLYFFAGM